MTTNALNNVSTIFIVDSLTFDNSTIEVTGNDLVIQNDDTNDIQFINTSSDILITLNDGGEYLTPLNAAFNAYNSTTDTNQTGNGATVSPVEFNTEVYDDQGVFSSNTFTAPVTGLYGLSGAVTFGAIGSGMTTGVVTIVTSNRSYVFYGNPFAMQNANNEVTFYFHTMADMDASDTCTITAQISGGTGDTASILGAASNYYDTYFSGELLQ